MSNTKRMRGKGVKPVMTHRSIRIPPDVLGFFSSNYDNPTKAMREVLINFARNRLDGNDNSEVNCNYGGDTREESEGQSSQDSQGE